MLTLLLLTMAAPGFISPSQAAAAIAPWFAVTCKAEESESYFANWVYRCQPKQPNRGVVFIRSVPAGQDRVAEQAEARKKMAEFVRQSPDSPEMRFMARVARPERSPQGRPGWYGVVPARSGDSALSFAIADEKASISLELLCSFPRPRDPDEEEFAANALFDKLRDAAFALEKAAFQKR